MPCEIASFSENDKYGMSLFFINFYISLIIIIAALIFANAVYNYYVYNNILLDKIYKDTKLIVDGEYPNKDGKDDIHKENNILIGETVDYKLFISLIIDQNMYYNDKYFTLNITNILLDVFVLITIVLVFLSMTYVFLLAKLPALFALIKLKLNFTDLKEYILQYCYFINNSGCNGYHMFKIVLIVILFIILIIIYGVRRGLPSINYRDYLDFKKSIEEPKKNPKHIENMLNIICNDEEDFLNNDNNINKIINKLNGHNIDTVDIIQSSITNDIEIETLKKASDNAYEAFKNANKEDKEDKDAKKKLSDKAKTEYDNAIIYKFINKIKEISKIIKENKTDTKDFDFVKLVIVYLNNKKIYNKNNGIPGQITDLGKTYAQSLLNIITNIIPGSNNLFGHFKTSNYDIEDILIGAIPLSKRDSVFKDGIKCKNEEGEYRSKALLKDINIVAGCFYNNYIFELKETSYKLKVALLVILIFTILSMIAIMVLFYYIYINYNGDNMIWANTSAIKMQRLSWKNPLNWFSMLSGNIMFQLNKYNS